MRGAPSPLRGGGLVPVGGWEDYEPPNPFDPANRKKGPTLPQFDPAGGVAQPGNTGRQRLASAAKGSNASEEGAGEGNGEGVGDSPGSWFGSWLDTLLDVFSAIDDWLSNDPPRDDYTVLDVPPPPAAVTLERPQDFSDERWEAARALVASLLTAVCDARNAKICLDRMGGASLADEREWTWLQAQALTHYKRQCGLDLVALAEIVDRYRQVLEAEGVEDTPLPDDEPDDLAEIQRQAAEALGIPLEEIVAAHTARAEGRGRFGRIEALRRFADGLRAEGAVWSRLPEVPLPPAPAGAAITMNTR